MNTVQRLERIAHRGRDFPPAAIRRSKPTLKSTVHTWLLVEQWSTLPASPAALGESFAALTAAQLIRRNHLPTVRAQGTARRGCFCAFALPVSCFPAASISPPQTPNPDRPLRGICRGERCGRASPTSRTARPFPLDRATHLLAALAAHSKTRAPDCRYVLCRAFKANFTNRNRRTTAESSFHRHTYGKAQK